MSRDRVVALIKSRINQRGLYGTQLSPPGKTQYKNDNTKYPFFKWDSTTKAWIKDDMLLSEVPEYIYDEEQEDWLQTGQTLQANNVIQLLGIAKYQSIERQIMNPNICLHTISDPKGHFFIYRYHPIYAINDTPAQTMNRMIERFSAELKQQGQQGIAKNPYEMEHGLSIVSETRFGCILCPYKPKSYYERLKEISPVSFWYCRLLELMGSVRRLVGNVRDKRLEEIEEMVYRYYREGGEI